MVSFDELHFKTILDNSTPEILIKLILNTDEQLHNPNSSEEEMEYLRDVRNSILEYYVQVHGVVDLFCELQHESQRMFDDMQEYYKNKGA